MIASLFAALLVSSSAQAPKLTFVEDFETGSNTGNWSFFGDPARGLEVIDLSGGNPGGFLHSVCGGGLACLDTFAPQLRTQLGVDSIFTGDYRGKGVVALGVDLAVFGRPGVTTEGRPLTLILRHDPGTPSDPLDDLVVYRLGNRNIPSDNGTWRRFRFHVPSSKTTLPAGWHVLQGSGDDDADWNQVIQDVSQAEYFFGDPTSLFILQQWELGADNLSIRLDADELPLSPSRGEVRSPSLRRNAGTAVSHRSAEARAGRRFGDLGDAGSPHGQNTSGALAVRTPGNRSDYAARW
jgi:hypothetical protein